MSLEKTAAFIAEGKAISEHCKKRWLEIAKTDAYLSNFYAEEIMLAGGLLKAPKELIAKFAKYHNSAEAIHEAIEKDDPTLLPRD